jgi:transketolase
VTAKDLTNFKKFGWPLASHPLKMVTPWMDATTGSLGQGIGWAMGAAVADHLKGVNKETYTIIGDGSSQEGQVDEAIQMANRQEMQGKLGGLTVIMDRNRIQLSQTVEENEKYTPGYWEKYGWHAVTVKMRDDGGNFDEDAYLERIDEALKAAENETEKPTILIIETEMGSGVSFMEKETNWTLDKSELSNRFHVAQFTREQIDEGLKELRGKVSALEEEMKREEGLTLQDLVAEVKAGARADINGMMGVEKRNAPAEPLIAPSERNHWKQDENRPKTTTKALVETLAEAALTDPRIVFLTGDLSGSSSTGANIFRDTMKQAGLEGRYYDLGIREQGIMNVAKGLAANGMIPVFVFYEAMTPLYFEQLRFAALDNLPVIAIAACAGDSAGQNEPTHQDGFASTYPSGLPGTTVIEPGDPNDARELILAYLRNPQGPAYILGGSWTGNANTGHPVLDRGTNPTPEKGAYVMREVKGKPDAILVGAGTIMPNVVDAYNRLTAQGKKVRLINVTTLKDGVLQKVLTPLLTPGVPVFTVQDANREILGNLVSGVITTHDLGNPVVRIGIEGFGTNNGIQKELADKILRANSVDEEGIVYNVNSYLAGEYDERIGRAKELLEAVKETTGIKGDLEDALRVGLYNLLYADWNLVIGDAVVTADPLSYLTSLLGRNDYFDETVGRIMNFVRKTTGTPQRMVLHVMGSWDQLKQTVAGETNEAIDLVPYYVVPSPDNFDDLTARNALSETIIRDVKTYPSNVVVPGYQAFNVDYGVYQGRPVYFVDTRNLGLSEDQVAGIMAVASAQLMSPLFAPGMKPSPRAEAVVQSQGATLKNFSLAAVVSHLPAANTQGLHGAFSKVAISVPILTTTELTGTGGKMNAAIQKIVTRNHGETVAINRMTYAVVDDITINELNDNDITQFINELTVANAVSVYDQQLLFNWKSGPQSPANKSDDVRDERISALIKVLRENHATAHLKYVAADGDTAEKILSVYNLGFASLSLDLSDVSSPNKAAQILQGLKGAPILFIKGYAGQTTFPKFQPYVLEEGAAAPSGNSQDVLDITIPQGVTAEELPELAKRLPFQRRVIHIKDIKRLLGATTGVLVQHQVASVLRVLMSFGSREIRTVVAAQQVGYGWDVSDIQFLLAPTPEGREQQLQALENRDIAGAGIKSETALYNQAKALEATPQLRAEFLSAIRDKMIITAFLLSPKTIMTLKDSEVIELLAAYKNEKLSPIDQRMLAAALLKWRELKLNTNQQKLEADNGQSTLDSYDNLPPGAARQKLFESMSGRTSSSPQDGSIAAVLRMFLNDLLMDSRIDNSTYLNPGQVNITAISDLLKAA